jgi:tetratricopeptide (TPR) repeat protein
MASAGIEPHECVCIVCLDSDPPPIQSGCACRSDTGLAHVGCLIEKAVAQQPHRGTKVWWECQTCGQYFTGAMRTGLAEAFWSRVCDEEEESEERLSAAHNLADARSGQGQYAEAERIEREVLGVKRRVLGEEHPATLTSANNLAQSLSDQGQYAEAEQIHREVLSATRRVLGEEHPGTLASASNLAQSLSRQGKHAEAERINREVLGARRRVLGEEHPATLNGASSLAKSLSDQGQYAEAEQIQ